jgi:hypothetical protein
MLTRTPSAIPAHLSSRPWTRAPRWAPAGGSSHTTSYPGGHSHRTRRLRTDSIKRRLFFHNPEPIPEGDKMPNGRLGSAHPLAASPVTSGLREDECTGPSPGLCPGPVPHLAGSPARRCGTPSSDWPRGRASGKGRGSPRPPGGTVHWRCGLPRPPGQGSGGQTASCPQRPSWQSPLGTLFLLHTGPAPCGAHGAVPRPGRAHRQTRALTGHHCDPSCVRRRRAPATAAGGVAWPAGVAGVRPVQSYQDLGKGMTVRMCLPSNVTASPRSGRPLPGLGWLSMVPV